MSYRQTDLFISLNRPTSNLQRDTPRTLQTIRAAEERRMVLSFAAALSLTKTCRDSTIFKDEF
jgi:hypothetical protein